MTLTKLASFASVSLLVIACGDSTPPAEAPVPPPPAPPALPVEPVASAAPVVDAGPPPMKGSFTAFARAASSGKVDKIGEKDGVFKADGVKDQVFDVEFEGAAAAFFLASVDDAGTANGEFDADTMTGSQAFPKELARTMGQGSSSAGIGVYEGDKLLNGTDGGLTALADGKHKLTFYISSKNAPKGAMKVFATLTDGTVVAGPVVTAAADAKAAPAGKTPAAPKTPAAKK